MLLKDSTLVLKLLMKNSTCVWQNINNAARARAILNISPNTGTIFHYSRFQVTFQSPVPKFVLNIPNYITKFGILCGICKAKFACW